MRLLQTLCPFFDLPDPRFFCYYEGDVVEQKCSAEDNFRILDFCFFKLGIPSNYRIHQYYFTNRNVIVCLRACYR